VTAGCLPVPGAGQGHAPRPRTTAALGAALVVAALAVGPWTAPAAAEGRAGHDAARHARRPAATGGARRPATTAKQAWPPAWKRAHAARAVQAVPVLPGYVQRQLRGSRPLESRWVPAGFLAAALLAALLWRWRGRRHPAATRRRRVWRATAATGSTAALLVLAVLAGVNSDVGYVPTLGALFGRRVTGGGAAPARRPQALGDPTRNAGSEPLVPGGSRVDRDMVAAPAYGVPPRPVYVYLPPGYELPREARLRYPVVYLIHGYPGSALDWFRSGAVRETMDTLIADRLVHPMIVVAPNAAASWASDSECLDAVGRGRKLESYLTRTVVDFVDHRYRTIRSRWARAIGGMSSGAYCGLNLGLRHQDEFSVILAHEPYGTPGDVARRRLLGGSWARYRANSPSIYLRTLTFRYPMAVFLDAGSSDRGVIRTARSLALELAGRGQLVAFRLARGVGHNWREARLALPYSLVFAVRYLLPPR